MIELRGMTWDHPRGYEPLIACSALYAETHSVNVSWDKRSLKDFGDQPLDQLISEYDILIIDHPHSGIAAATGALIALDDVLETNVLETLREQSAGPSHASYEYNGKQWALAIDAAMQTGVYRADLMHDTLPQTWDEVVALGEKLRRDDCYVAVPLVPTDAMCSFITLCASIGEPIGRGSGLISDAVGRQVLELLRTLCRVAHPESLNWNPIFMLDYMSTHDDVAYCPLTFGYTNYSRRGYKPHLLTFTDIPGAKGSILGGTGFAVSANSDYPVEAAQFGAWVCSGEVQSGVYVREGGQPGNAAAWADDEANRLTNNFFQNTLQTLENSVIRPRHHGFTKFQEQAGMIVHEFLRRGSSVERCLSDLQTLYARHS